jgi:hypothetical protein
MVSRQVKEAEIWLTRIFFFRTLSEMIHENWDLKINWAPFSTASGTGEASGEDSKQRSRGCFQSIVPALVLKRFDLASGCVLDKLGFKSGQA